MKRKPFFATFALSIAALAGGVSAADLSINFHPAAGVWSYPLESARGLNSVLLQNIAIVNRGPTSATIVAIEIEAMREDEAIVALRLNANKLDSAAKQGSALAQSGLMQALEFQFAPDALFGKGTMIADTRTLAPGAALYVSQQMLSYRGQADRLRLTVRVDGETEPNRSEIAIRNGFAPGRFRFPLAGRWMVMAGATAHGHHRWAVPEEFALDLARIGEGGLTYRGDGTRMQDYYAYDAPVLAVADGEVVKTHDGEEDNLTMLRGANESLQEFQQRVLAGQQKLLAVSSDAISGNHVVIRHADGVHSVYAHLKPDSLAVKPGDRVVAGQTIAALGGSGNSTEPHLHFHLCDGPDALRCAGMPVRFENIEIPFNLGPGELQTGDLVDAR